MFCSSEKLPSLAACLSISNYASFLRVFSHLLAIHLNILPKLFPGEAEQ